jgi:acetyl esterase/lipase
LDPRIALGTPLTAAMRDLTRLMTAPGQTRTFRLRAPIIVTYGTYKTAEFQRQNRDFAAAVKAAGKPVELVEAPHFNHFEILESLGNPYGPNGRSALALMKLSSV